MKSIKIDDLEVNFHKCNHISIKDLSHDIKLSETKWNTLFSLFLENVEGVYFYGLDLNYNDDNLVDAVNYCSEYILVDDYEQSRLVFKVKEASILLNRALLYEIWNYYYYPSLIFIDDINQERDLINIINRERGFIKNVLDELNDVKITYMEFERNVLWLQHNHIENIFVDT